MHRLLLLPLAFLVAVLVLMAPQPRSMLAQEVSDPDELLIVDCLLPGKIRKLGKRTTYVTPRRPVRTAAVDCGIRGSEYTSYDRADYKTALGVWLPLAKQGDPVAPNYVGEIYEKGLGVDPQHKLAADWYLKAAEQGFSQAQINLGQLFERGLGVPADMTQALFWYREASGLSGSDIQFVPSGDVAAELKTLREEMRRRDRTSSAAAVTTPRRGALSLRTCAPRLRGGCARPRPTPIAPKSRASRTS